MPSWSELLIAASACAFLVTSASAQNPDVIVRVNGAPITRGQVREVVKGVIAASERPPGSEEIERLSQAALDSLIDLELLYQEAKARQIRIGEDEVEAEIQRNRKRFGDPESFAQALQRSGLSEKQLREETIKTLLANRLLEQVVWKGITVSPQAVRTFYDENRSEFENPPVSFAQAQERIVRVLEEEEKRRRQAEFVAALRQKASIETAAASSDAEEGAQAPGASDQDGDKGAR